MNKKKKSKGNPLFKIVLGILLVFLFFNFLILSIRIASEGSYSGYCYEYSEMSRAFERKDYADLADMIRTNEALGFEPENDVTEFKSFVKFYDAATLYEAYRQAGEEENCRKFQTIMQENKEKLVTPEIIQGAEDFLQSLQP